MKSYSEQRKLYYDDVIRKHYETGYGEKRLCRIFPVSHTTITRWITRFASENRIDRNAPYEIYLKVMAKKTKEESVDPYVKTLREEVKRLQLKVKEAEMKAELYDHMIDIAEEKFNIPIRKKSGAKR